MRQDKSVLWRDRQRIGRLKLLCLQDYDKGALGAAACNGRGPTQQWGAAKSRLKFPYYSYAPVRTTSNRFSAASHQPYPYRATRPDQRNPVSSHIFRSIQLRVKFRSGVVGRKPFINDSILYKFSIYVYIN
jgi:hypothetical protein